MLRFDNRVAVVTGAGGGLGRIYALKFAERGASVVVNDLGGSQSGDGKGSAMADKVVGEIRQKGGKATANYDSVENGENIIKTAIDNYGRVDIVVNNAGLTLTIFPKEMLDRMQPEYVMPLTLWLCHESCQESGGVFEACGGWFGQAQWYRSKGKVVRGDGQPPEPEDVRDNWEQIKDMNGAQHFTGQEVGLELHRMLTSSNSGDSGKREERFSNSSSTSYTGRTNPELAKRHQFPTLTYEYNTRDAIIYALGVGAQTPQELNLLYENHENFQPLPTFAVIPGLAATMHLQSVEGLNVNLSKLLHGEQYLEVYKPWLAEGRVRSTAKIADVLDKRSGAAVLVDVETTDESGDKLAYGQYTIFLVGEGNFGGNRTSPVDKPTQPLPQRQPDVVVEQNTCTNQAALYRQGSGDYNPLHVDPIFAQAAGFKQPILHGLCSMGFSVRHILNHYAGGDVNKFLAIKTRFSKPVLPGQTLVTEMWKEADRVHFQTKVKETGEVALSGGYVQLKSISVARKPAFMQGKLKIKGNLMLTQRLQKLLRDQAKL